MEECESSQHHGTKQKASSKDIFQHLPARVQIQQTCKVHSTNVVCSITSRSEWFAIAQDL